MWGHPGVLENEFEHLLENQSSGKVVRIWSLGLKISCKSILKD